jgi:hypothetical protein
MKKLPGFVFVIVSLLAVHSLVGAAEMTPHPLPPAHAHNDYEHPRPLLDALDHGFCSVEADIYLVGDQLLVAHERNQVRPERTLQRLYLEPLQARVQQNGGRVYRGGPPLVLLVDIKSDAEKTYAALRTVLLGYTNMLTRFTQDGISTNAVTVIISGNRPTETVAAQPVRYAGIDGRPADLERVVSFALIPLVSEDWKRLFSWRGQGPFPAAEQERLRDLVNKAHQQHRMLRFWGTPDRKELWQHLFDSGVDLLNADDLGALRAFLLAQPEEQPKSARQ